MSWYAVPRRGRRIAYGAVALLLAIGGGAVVASNATVRPASAAVAALRDVVPAPVRTQPTAGTTFTLRPDAGIFTAAGSTAAADVGGYLAGILRRSTGYPLPLASASSASSASPAGSGEPAAGSGKPAGGIWLLLAGADPSVGQQGYQLDVTAERRGHPGADGRRPLRRGADAAPAPAAGDRERQRPARPVGRARWPDHRPPALRLPRHDAGRRPALPPGHDHQAVPRPDRALQNQLPAPAPLRRPGLAHRRRQLATADHRRRQHPGRRRPRRLTTRRRSIRRSWRTRRHGTSRSCPEIDMPGHTNAALASYAELNCNGVAPPLYTGTGVGFSSLCTSKDVIYTFIDNVLSELAALTPGPYLHIGGDEADTLSAGQYATFMNRAQPIVAPGARRCGAGTRSRRRGTRRTGSCSSGTPAPRVRRSTAAVSRGARVVLSPANKAYLDMKYNARTPLGQSWAGLIEVRTRTAGTPAPTCAACPPLPCSASRRRCGPRRSSPWATSTTWRSRACRPSPSWAGHPVNARLGRVPDASGRAGTTVDGAGIGFYRSPQVPWPAPV